MSAELDVDALEAQLAPRPGHTEPDWDTEDAERWLRALITEVRRLRDRVQELEGEVDNLEADLHSQDADYWRERAEPLETAARAVIRRYYASADETPELAALDAALANAPRRRRPRGR